MPGGWARYRAQFPREITDADTYRIEAHRQIGAAPDPTDGPPLYDANFVWNGVNVATVLPSDRWSDMRAAVQTNLGGNLIDVELTDQDYVTALAASIRELNRWHPMHGAGALPWSPSVQYYRVTHPRLIGILDVEGVVPADAARAECYLFDTPFGVSQFGYGGFGGLTTPQSYGEMEQLAHNRNAAAQAQGLDLDWEQFPAGPGAVDLYVAGGRAGMKVSYRFTWGISPDDDAQTGVSRIPEAYWNMVIDFAHARAKQILGRSLRKYGGINMPDGTVEPLDGEALMQEGIAKEEAMAPLWKAIRRPVPPRRL
jgi:hypothetical protein